jgi:hypothetical protein
MAQVATNTAMTTRNHALLVRLNIIGSLTFIFGLFSRSASHWHFPLLPCGYRVLIRGQSQTHPIAGRTRLALLA